MFYYWIRQLRFTIQPNYQIIILQTIAVFLTVYSLILQKVVFHKYVLPITQEKNMNCIELIDLLSIQSCASTRVILFILLRCLETNELNILYGSFQSSIFDNLNVCNRTIKIDKDIQKQFMKSFRLAKRCPLPVIAKLDTFSRLSQLKVT